jgi:hypothetical protein
VCVIKVKRFGITVERDVPERADAETADCSSSRELRERLGPCLQGRTYAKDSFQGG